MFTVEYSIGLEQPATPKRYQATNLNRHRILSLCFFPFIGFEVEVKEKAYFNAVGMFQTIMQIVEKDAQTVKMVYKIQLGYIAANVVPNHDATIRIP